MNPIIIQFMENKKFDSQATFRTFQYTLRNFLNIVEDGGGDINRLTEYDIRYYFQKREDKKSQPDKRNIRLFQVFLNITIGRIE